MTRSKSYLLFLTLAAAVTVGCGSDTAPGGARACKPLATASCYTGSGSTAGVGACSRGTMVCSADGSAFGECSGSVLPSFQGCSTGVDTDCDGKAVCSGEHRWSYGLLGQGYKVPVGVYVDKNGDIAVAGDFEGTIDLGGGELKADTSLMMRDMWVGKIDANGKHLWSKRIGNAADQMLEELASDRDGNVILTGWSETPAEFEGVTLQESFTLKLGPGGEVLWSIPHSGYLGVDGEGNVILAGGFTGSFKYEGKELTSVGERDAYIAKFDPSGKLLWVLSAGGAGSEYLHHVEADGAGNIVVAGQYSGVADLGGGPMPPGAPNGNESAFVAKFDKDGAFLWSRSFVGQSVRARFLSADKAGNTVFGGMMYGSVDFGGGHVEDGPPAFLTKLGPNGETLFSEGYMSDVTAGSTSYAHVGNVAFDAEDNMLVLGLFHTAIHLGGGVSLKAAGDAVFVAKYDALGKIIWGMTPGGGQVIDANSGISADPLGGVVVTGLYGASALDFGGGILYGNPGQPEIFLAHLAP